MTYRLIPEWETASRLVFVWPERMEGCARLVSLYTGLIRLLPSALEVCVVLKARALEGEVKARLAKVNPYVALRFIEMPSVPDIFIREWAPAVAAGDAEKLTAVMAKHLPGGPARDEAARILAKECDISLVEMPLVWNPANITHNGKGIAVVTDRVVKENPGIAARELERLFGEFLGISRLIVVPEGPRGGSIDRMARFLDPDTVGVGEYPAVHVDERIFMDDIACMLAKELGEDFRIVRIPDGPLAKGRGGSAAGSHLGFLRTGEYVLMPFYGTPEDAAACAALRAASDGIEPVPVELPGVRVLASSGGVLNSICRPF